MSESCLGFVPVPLVDFAGWDADLGSQARDLSLGPVLVLIEGPLQELDMLLAKPVLLLTLLTVATSLRAFFRRHSLTGLVRYLTFWGRL